MVSLSSIPSTSLLSYVVCFSEIVEHVLELYSFFCCSYSCNNVAVINLSLKINIKGLFIVFQIRGRLQVEGFGGMHFNGGTGPRRRFFAPCFGVPT